MCIRNNQFNEPIDTKEPEYIICTETKMEKQRVINLSHLRPKIKSGVFLFTRPTLVFFWPTPLIFIAILKNEKTFPPTYSN